MISSSTVSGTPWATPEAEPKLLVMSLRTMPDSVRTFGPFDPSPGYGPAVSSGISSTLVGVEEVPVVGVPEVVADGLLADGVLPPGAASSAEQPATTARPAPASSRRTFRR